MSTNALDDDGDAVLSDVEGDDPIPIEIKSRSQSHSQEERVSIEKYREVLSELEKERIAKEAIEVSKSELEVKFNRLKGLAHEAIKKRDEANREKEEAFRANEKLSSELIEVNKQKEDILREKNEILRLKEGLEKEIEQSRHMLASGIEKISGKVSNFKNFAALGLPNSQKYNGLCSIAYGVIKRTNEIVEELVREIDSAVKGRNEARESMEQRNYEIAIEVSQLEATIGGLREEVVKKDGLIGDLEGRVVDAEREMVEKTGSVNKEVLELRELVGEYDVKLRSLESRAELLRPLMVDQLNLVAQIHDRLYDVIKTVDENNLDSELLESLFFPQQTDLEENIRASLAGMESIYELSRIVVDKTRDLVEEKNHEVKSLSETVDRLVKEKEHIGSLLRGALSKRMNLDSSSKSNELFKTAENGLREAGFDFKFSKVLGENNGPPSLEKAGSLNADEDEIYSLASALENIVKASQLEIIELKHCVEKLRAESSLLKEHVEAQDKELTERMRRIEDLQEKERVANENIEGLMMDIAVAEEEIARWKVAAEQEAAAGRGVEQDFVGQLSSLKQELEDTRQAMIELEKKLKLKEETADAAMAAREAAEKSLRLADMRATRLRDRVEELSRQIEEFENREDSGGRNGPRYACWPWQWLGLDFVGVRRLEAQQQSSNEMELSEPLSEPLL